MKKVEVEIEGTAPLLMHSAENMESQGIKSNPAKNYDAEVDAEKVAYRDDGGYLYVPSRCLKACILNASSWMKSGKNALKPIIAGCTKIEPHKLFIYDPNGKKIKDYIIDKRPVVIQRSRIIRARPRIDKWVLKFDLIYNEGMLGKVIDKIGICIEDAGTRIGLLDNRPQKYGENGTFKVIKFLPK